MLNVDSSDIVAPSRAGPPTPRVPESVLEQLVSFPRNTEAQAQLVFKLSAAAGENSALPDPRAVALTIHYSLSELPDDPSFETRPADERLGHFATSFDYFGGPESGGSSGPPDAGGPPASPEGALRPPALDYPEAGC